MKVDIISHLHRSLFLVALAHLAIEISNNFLPVVYPLLISRMGLTYTQVGFIALVAGGGASLTQPLFGYLADRWGARRLIILSIAWIGLIMGLVGLAGNYSVLVALVGLGALGSAAFHPAGAALAVAHSGERRGMAMSLFSVGGNLGTALSPLWIALGLAWWGLEGTILLIPTAALVSLYLARQLEPVEVEALPLPAKGALQVRPDSSQQRIGYGTLLGLALIIIAVMSRSWFQISFMTYLPEWIQNQGGSLTVGGQVLFVFMASVGFGSLTGGALSDYIGRWQVMILSLGLVGPAYWLFLSASGLLWIVSVGLMGVLIGSTFPVTLVMAQEAWPERVGLASALVMGLGWAPGGLGASVTGLVADRFSLAVGLQTLLLAPLVGLGATLIYAALLRHGLGASEGV